MPYSLRFIKDKIQELNILLIDILTMLGYLVELLLVE